MEPTLKAPIHKNRRTTMEQISNFISPESLFKDINLFSKLYDASVPLTSTR